jgi:hypothetical protein
MPKSRHRKNQKKKSKARTAKINAQQTAFKKQMDLKFKQYLEDLENKRMDIEEVKDKP